MPHWVGEPDKSAYREDIQTGEGIRFIQENADRPFFLYQSYYTPHAPFQPPRKYAEMYEDREIANKKLLCIGNQPGPQRGPYRRYP